MKQRKFYNYILVKSFLEKKYKKSNTITTLLQNSIVLKDPKINKGESFENIQNNFFLSK